MNQNVCFVQPVSFNGR